MNKVIVVGSINMDVVAVASRHPRAGETVMGEQLHLLPGGKGANQAVAACRAGAETTMVGRVGSDTFSNVLLDFLRAEHLDLSLTRRTEQTPSGTAIIAVAGGQNTIVVVPGANGALTPADLAALEISSDDVVVAQLEVPQDTITAAFVGAARSGATTMLNAAPAAECDATLLQHTDVLVVNETELHVLSGADANLTPEDMTIDEVVGTARTLRVHDGQVVVVTLGASGVVAVDRESVIRIDGHPVDVVDTTGAGDCFVGNLAAQLSAGADLETALRGANRASALCVQGLGAAVSMPRAEQATAKGAAAA